MAEIQSDYLVEAGLAASMSLSASGNSWFHIEDPLLAAEVVGKLRLAEHLHRLTI